MREFIPSISAGSLTTILLTISGMGIAETIILAFIGGIAGFLGKLAISWAIKKIKNLFNETN